MTELDRLRRRLERLEAANAANSTDDDPVRAWLCSLVDGADAGRKGREIFDRLYRKDDT